jgi:hypothetical protein
MLDSTPRRSLADRIPLEPCNAPETRLLLAVLHDALETFQRGLLTSDCKDREAFREVDRWFRSDDYDWPFSFENICGTLLIDPDHIRDGLNQLRIAALTKRNVKKKRMVVRERFCNRRAWNAPLGG